MGRLKKFRIMVGLIKDKSSIIKATLSTKPYIAKLRISVVQATAHGGSAPPSENRVDSVLSLGHRYDAGYECINALMSRLHGTKNASVALKTLFLVHIILTKGSFLIKNHLSLYLSRGGLNFLNLSNFREDQPDYERAWVRWYSSVLEHNIKVSTFLEYNIFSSLSNNEKEEKVWALMSKDLLGEIEILVDFVNVTSQFPDSSLDMLKNDLIYEIVRLVSDDYRAVQLEILIRVGELRNRIPSLSTGELSRVMGELRRLESMKERFSKLFMNRNRNDGLWELVGETNKEIAKVINKNGNIKLLKMGTATYEYDSTRWTRFSDEFNYQGQLVAISTL
ncbi:ENTH/ANTH/VHS superfamily protein [Euphorbia peplus]|nr:ENTH/ANTH/VHS superfamily protein [Euphorbia peplus]